MRTFFQKCFKAINLLSRNLKTKICTCLFKIKLWINQVDYGKGIKAINAIPDFIVSLRNLNVRIGNNVHFMSYSHISWYTRCRIVVGKDAILSIDDYSGLNGTLIYCMKKIQIGKYVHIGGGCRIYDTNFHNLDWEARRDPKLNGISSTSPVIIGDDVFIGTDCIIGKGVTIGSRSIVAAGSVVVKSIPEDELWGGNPAKFIKKINGK